MPLLALFLLLTSSCATPAGDGDWGAEVGEYFGAFAAAANAGDLEATMAFFADDATLVGSSGLAVAGARRIDAAIQGSMVDGTRAPLMALASTGPDLDATRFAGFGLDPGEALLVSDIGFGESQGCPADRVPCQLRELAVVALDGNLIGTYATLVAEADLRVLVGEDPEVLAELDAMEAFYRSYAQVWTDGSPEEVSALYDPFAEVYHPIWQAHASGRDGVAGLAGRLHDEQGGVAVTPLTLGDLGAGPAAPAVFFAGAPGAPHLQAGLYRVTVGGQEPVVMGVVWRRGPTGISQEWSAVRVGDAGAARAVEAADPWWEGLEPPTVIAPDCHSLDRAPGGLQLEVCNSTGELDELVRWALGRFERAGLAVPAPTRVSFPPSERCRRAASGLAVDTGDGVQVQLCFGTEALGPGAASNAPFTLLHELGHVWAAQNLAEGERAAFVAWRGLEAWRDPEAGWAEQGSEHAAETIAWGLMDHPVDVARLPDAGCDRLSEGFHMLTGLEPLITVEECEAR